MITENQHQEARKRIVPCLCMTCGVRNDHSHPSGFCQNNHDNWLEYRDVYRNNEFFHRALKQSGLSEDEFIKLFLDIDNKFIPQNIITDKSSHFIALVKMEGEFEGRIGQHSTCQASAEAARAWANSRFSRPAVIVDMAQHNNANSLPTEVAQLLYDQGIQTL